MEEDIQLYTVLVHTCGTSGMNCILYALWTLDPVTYTDSAMYTRIHPLLVNLSHECSQQCFECQLRTVSNRNLQHQQLQSWIHLGQYHNTLQHVRKIPKNIFKIWWNVDLICIKSYEIYIQNYQYCSLNLRRFLILSCKAK